jgi:hypothetical protein
LPNWKSSQLAILFALNLQGNGQSIADVSSLERETEGQNVRLGKGVQSDIEEPSSPQSWHLTFEQC